MNLECKSCGNVAPSGIRKCPRCKASLVQPSAGAWKLIALLVVFGGLVGLFVAAPALSWCLYVVIAVSGIAAAVGAWKTNPPPACVKVLNLAKRTPKVGWAIAAMVTVASLISLPIAAERSRQHALEERAERDAEARRQEAARVAAEQAAAARAAEQRAVDEVRQRFPAERERIEGVLRTIEQTDLSKSWKDAEAQVASLGMLLEPIRKSPDAGRPEVAATLAKFDAQKERLQAAERERAAVALREDYLGNRARLEKDTKALERLSPARQLPEASDRLAALASGLGKYDSLPESVEGLKV